MDILLPRGDNYVKARNEPNRPNTYKAENEQAAVPQLQGRAHTSDAKANPIIAGTSAPSLKVYHSTPHKAEKPISDVYAEIDTDLARDNLENDLTAADLQDL